MEKASIFWVGILGVFLILTGSVQAEKPPSPPVGYFLHGDFFCNSDPNFEKPDSAGLWPADKKFCQPQAIGCQAIGGKFCTAGTMNYCCSATNACGKGTAYGFEVAVCVPPTSATCGPKSSGYAGRTKEGKNICCRTGQEPGPAGGTKAPYCQPISRSFCQPGERFIQGTGGHQDEKRCCANDTTPAHHPNGLPFCARLPIPPVPPINNSDLTPPELYLLSPSVGLTTPNKGTNILIQAVDVKSGVASLTIIVVPPQPQVPLFKTCDNTRNGISSWGSCALIVPADSWVAGTMLMISAIDYSPNHNTTTIGDHSYIIETAGLQAN